MSSRRLFYLYAAPHAFVLSEDQIQRIGLELAWPIIALFGTYLRDTDETPGALLHRFHFIAQHYMGCSLFNCRRRRPWSLLDYGIEKEATLCLITRPQIAIGVVCWTLSTTVGVIIGWFGYSYGAIAIVRVWWFCKGVYELVVLFQNPRRLRGDLVPILCHFAYLFMSFFIFSQRLSAYFSPNIQVAYSYISPFWRERWRCVEC